jgi:hypothetical protein
VLALQNHHRIAQALRFILSGGVVGALLLSLQTASPLNDGPHAAGWFNWLCLTALMSSLAVFLGTGAKDERWVSGACLVTASYLLFSTQPWNATSVAELASSTSRFLSTTWHGLAIVALICGWSLVGFGFLAGRAVLALYEDSTAVPPRIAAWLVGLTVTLFGLRGLMGYATGSISFFSP